MKRRIDDIVFEDGDEAARVLTDAGFRVERRGLGGFVFPAVLPANYPEVEDCGTPYSLAIIEGDGNVLLCNDENTLVREYHVRIAEVINARSEDCLTAPSRSSKLNISRAHLRILAFAEGEPYFLLEDLRKNLGATFLRDVKLDELREAGLIEALGRMPISVTSITPKSGRYLYRLTPLGLAVLQASTRVTEGDRRQSHPYR